MRMEGQNYLEGIRKTQNIKAFERLILLTVEKQWRGQKLDDRTEEGLATCLKTCLQLSGFHAIQSGRIVETEINDESFVFEVLFGKISTRNTDSQNAIIIRSIAQFFEWYDGI